MACEEPPQPQEVGRLVAARAGRAVIAEAGDAWPVASDGKVKVRAVPASFYPMR